MIKKLLRLTLCLIATPIIVLAFGFFWAGFVAVFGPIFALISFVEDSEFSWSDWMHDSDNFFMDPLRSLWGSKR